MFERFTDRARRALVLAQEEARRRGHTALGTEHLLCGLVSEVDGVAATALRSFGISADDVHRAFDEVVDRPEDVPHGAPPFTASSKKVLEYSLREAMQLGHDYIGTEHLLLGLIRLPECTGAEMIESLGVPALAEVRNEVIDVLAKHQPPPPDGT